MLFEIVKWVCIVFFMNDENRQVVNDYVFGAVHLLSMDEEVIQYAKFSLKRFNQFFGMFLKDHIVSLLTLTMGKVDDNGASSPCSIIHIGLNDT